MLRWGSGARCASLREDDECLAGTHRYRPTWVEVDVTNIAENTRALASLGREKGLGLIAVVKADGYGHGALATAKAALSQGAEMLAVALPEEGATLRQGGITAPILVMGAYVPGTLEAYQRFSLMATVTDFDQLRSIVSESGGGRVELQLKVDTGMGRLGVLPQDAFALVQEASAAVDISVAGVYSHLATADDPDPTFAKKQIEAFEEILAELDAYGILPPMRHILNTAGFLRFDAGRTTMARVGLGLYGLYPPEQLKDKIDLKPAMTWKTRVATVKRVPPGMGVSYGQIYRTAKETTLATIPVGYADGFSRRTQWPDPGADRRERSILWSATSAWTRPSSTWEMRLSESVRRSCSLANKGTNGSRRDEWARVLGTINYEVVCDVSVRVPRVYTG